jgi:asparagine synthase (glutamine-hydrolysing)
MCGICGVVQVGGEPRLVVEPDVLDRMTDVMTHRGPNDRGTHVEPGVALGVRRLSIVDVEGGHQPVCNEDGTIWAVQNGELYNHEDVRRELLGGHRLASRCDTEILPHLYEEVGPAFAERVRGKFGMAVWDRRERRLVLARDRLGVKPLYYAEADDRVVFASELKSLLASGIVETELDYEAIDAYMTFGFVPGPLTPLAGVRKLMPGERLVVDPRGLRLERYWSYPVPEPDLDASEDELAEELIERLDEAVRLRLMSDVPLGAMLSGGLDSSLIVALMARHMSEPVKTFSVGFAEDAESELPDARYVSDFFGTEHHELELSYTQQVDLTNLVWAMDEPVADLSSLGFLAISELAARHVTVALSGQGADELLAGYKKHKAASLVAAWKRLPRPAQAAGNGVLERTPLSSRRSVRTLLASNPVERLIAMSGHVDERLRSELYRGPLAALDGGAAFRAVAPLAEGIVDEPLAATLHIDGQLALVDRMLHYFDRTSMMCSLEVRVPFLDHEVVEFCARVPDSLKVRHLQTKYLLRRAATGIVPERVIQKRKLGFFQAPLDGWLRAQLDGAISDYLLGPSPRYAEFLDRGAVERLVRAHREHQAVDVQLLVGVLMLEVWLASYLPRAAGAPTELPAPQPV